jgi:hypothetical protein
VREKEADHSNGVNLCHLKDISMVHGKCGDFSIPHRTKERERKREKERERERERERKREKKRERGRKEEERGAGLIQKTL